MSDPENFGSHPGKPQSDLQESRRAPLLISPEFEGIKTRVVRTAVRRGPLLISPEFEGIKTAVYAFAYPRGSLLISPEFEGIKTNITPSAMAAIRY